MAAQTPKPAVLSKTLRFLTAGGVALLVAIGQEVFKPDTDWNLVLTMLAGLLVGLGGGAYGRVVAQGPITTLTQPPTEGGGA